MTDTDTMATLGTDSVQADSLADYICDYLDEVMDPALREVFEAYVANQPDLIQYIDDARSGMMALHELRDLSTQAGDRV